MREPTFNNSTYGVWTGGGSFGQMYSTLASVYSRPKDTYPPPPLSCSSVNASCLSSRKKENKPCPESDGIFLTFFLGLQWRVRVEKKRCDGKGMVTELAQKICHTLP